MAEFRLTPTQRDFIAYLRANPVAWSTAGGVIWPSTTHSLRLRTDLFIDLCRKFILKYGYLTEEQRRLSKFTKTHGYHLSPEYR